MDAEPEPAPQLMRVDQAPDGTVTYLIDRSPSSLPPVRSGDLAAAWDNARSAALGAVWGGKRRFCFRQDDGTVTDLALDDRDAACWASAIQDAQGLHSTYGLSLCLRFLALMDLLARASWTRALCHVRRQGADLHPALLRLAATAELTNDARFDETRFRAGLGVLAEPPAGAFA